MKTNLLRLLACAFALNVAAASPLPPTRQVHLDFHTSEHIAGIGEKFDKAQFQAALREGRVNQINLFAKCHHSWSYYPTKIGRVHPNLKFDLLGAQIAACHEIDANPALFERMRGNVSRWSDAAKKRRCEQLLDGPWPNLREQLLADTETGAALRQDAPLGGILSGAERNRIMRQFADDPRAG